MKDFFSFPNKNLSEFLEIYRRGLKDSVRIQDEKLKKKLKKIKSIQDLENEVEKIQETLRNKKTTPTLRSKLKNSITEIRNRILQGLFVLGKEPFIDLKDFIEKSVELNVQLIQSIPQIYITKLDNIIVKGYESRDSLLSISKNILKAYPFVKSKAEFWARDQVSKIHGQTNKVLQESAGFNRYKWISGVDSRVRESHRIRRNKIYDWNSSDIIPGQEYNCRCTAVPYDA